MTDIWDKRPATKTHWIETGVFGYEYYPMEEWDAWLSKLKTEYDIFKTVSEVYKGIEDPVVIAKDKLDALKTKAEKWDELKNIVPKLEERLRLLEKLEAIRNWLNNHALNLSDRQYDSLKKILEIEK